MKKICLSSCILLFIFMLFLTSSFAQDTPQWQLPEGVKARIGKGVARDIALSPDNAQLAVATGIGVWLYNAQTGAEIALLTGHTDEVYSVAYSPDGQTLASGSNREIRLWDPSNQEHKTTFVRQDTTSLAYSPYVYGRTLAYSPDGRTLAVVRQSGVDLLNAQTGERKLSVSGHTYSVNSIAFSPDGEKLASSGVRNEDAAVHLWNARTGKLLRTLTGHAHGLHSLVFSPNGNTLVGGAWDGTLRVWDTNTGQNTRTLQEWSESVTYSPDGRKIAIAQGNDILLLNANTGVLQQRLSGHTNDSGSLVFSSDSNTLVSSSWDGTIRFWNVGTSSLRLTIDGHFNFSATALSPNGNLIATASESSVFLWNTRDGRFNKVLDGEQRIRALAYSPDGKTLALAMGGRQIQLLNAHTGQSRRTLRWEENDASAIVFSPNSKQIASASWDGIIRVWNANNGKLQRTLTAHTDGINSIVFSPDGNTLASASWDRTVRVWNPHTGQLQRTLVGHRDGIHALAFSPNGNTLVSGSWNRILFWNPRNGELQESLEDVQGYALAFSRDGKTLVAGNRWAIHLRNARTGEFQRVIPTSSGMNWLAFTPDNNTLISGSWSSIILLWNMNALPKPIPEDVNLDGVINVEDLITVARYFGQSVTDDLSLNADLNGDGVVNRQDVLKIMTALEAAAGAPPVSSETSMMLTAERLRHYIHTAKQLGNHTDEGFQRGIQVLEELLATLRTDITATPVKTTLLPNYPNPFNPETWIPYALATPADVKITIYDATGSVVRTLVLGHQAAGHYTDHDRAAYWDGRNTLGERVASGVYFYQLHADTVSLMRKMLILK